MQPRHAALALLLAGTLAAAFWPGEDDSLEGDVVEAVARPQRPLPPPDLGPASPPSDASALPDAQPRARFAMAGAANLFPAQSFRPPPKPVAPAPVLPPPPMAPPIPFTFVGAWHEEGQETVFLERGGQLITTHAGETLPGGWRLDTVAPEGLTFTYVSLNQQRTLRIGP